MRVILLLTVIALIVSCDKEEPQFFVDQDPLDNITPMPGWVVEYLNEDYYIQFPKYFVGRGFEEGCFDKTNPDTDLGVFQCYCIDYETFVCVGDCLSVPLPYEITRLPHVLSSSPLTLNNKEYLYDKDTILSGIMYYGLDISDENQHNVNGLNYKKINEDYISLLFLCESPL